MRLVSFIWEILQQNSPLSWPKDDRDFSREKNGERKVGGDGGGNRVFSVADLWRNVGDGMEFMSLFAD